MKTIKLVITFLAISLMALSACKKENQAPVVTIEEPAVNDTTANGNELHFEGMATDDNGLHEGRLQILTTSNNTALVDTILPGVHDSKSFMFHVHYLFNVTTSTKAIARATFSDHDGKSTTKEVAIVLTP